MANNQAYVSGGLLYMEGSGSDLALTIDTSTIQYNYASTGTGAVISTFSNTNKATIIV